MLSDYFIFFLDCYAPTDMYHKSTQKILVYCDYDIIDSKYSFSNIRIVKKDPDFPFPFTISPKFFEFDYDADIKLPCKFESDHEAIVYFTLKYCM